MKFGPVEITLIHPEDGPSFEERVVEGKHHFVAEIGKEFRVRVHISNFDAYPKDGVLYFTLYLDGERAAWLDVDLAGMAHQTKTFVFPLGNSSFEFKGQGFTFDAIRDQPDSKIGAISLSINSAKLIPSPPYVTPDVNVDSNFKIKNLKTSWQQPSACISFKPVNSGYIHHTSYLFDGRYEEKINAHYHTEEALNKWEKSLLIPIAAPPPPVVIASSTSVHDTVEDVTDTVVRPKKPKVEVVDLLDVKNGQPPGQKIVIDMTDVE